MNSRFSFCAGFPVGRGVQILISIVLLILGTASSEAGLKVYYLRHAEGGHNVVKEWAKVPKSERPVYVGNGNMFTPKGTTQVAAATEKLRKHQFDFIAVSPMWRTRHTILPYLKAEGQKGELWPELHEFSGALWLPSNNVAPPKGPIANAGSAIELPSEESAYFVMRADGTNDFKQPDRKVPGRDAALRAVLQHAIDLIHERFGGSDKTILLVGHGNSGKALLRMLVQDDLADTSSMVNTGLWMVEEQPDGKFKLKLYNDEPYKAKSSS